jgi:hypothetical protein
LTESLLAEASGSTPLVQKPAIGHDPEQGSNTCLINLISRELIATMIFGEEFKL